MVNVRSALFLRGDIGGFGVGSEFSWNVVAAYSFEVCTEGGVTYSAEAPTPSILSRSREYRC